ncbi:hypothetical protein CFC21_061204 [Triticum aestivum]|uniref:Uncharacterized protein n=2 Tax=Triticum aestivum TaxID=4565 RepID=A0A9R1KGI9_WHEAT|nr:hypothetical protein CFC21_061204 [Triticum aestivum]
MEVCSNFSSIKDMHKEADAVVKKATTEELKSLIPYPAKGAMSVDTLCWAMNQADSGDTGHMTRWAKYRAPHDQRVAMYWNSTLVALGVIGLEPEEEEEAMEMVVRALEPGHFTLTIDMDSGEDDETVVPPEDKNKATHHSNRLKGRQG